MEERKIATRPRIVDLTKLHRGGRNMEPMKKKAIELLCDIDPKTGKALPQYKIAALCNIIPATLAKWMKDEEFLKELNLELTKTFVSMRRTAIMGMNHHLRRKYYPAIKDVLTATGDLKDRKVIEDETKGKDAIKDLPDEELNKQLKAAAGELGYRHFNRKLEQGREGKTSTPSTGEEAEEGS